MSSGYERPLKFISIWILCFLFSVIAFFRLIFAYIVHFQSKPWRTIDRSQMAPPLCLSDPKYGAHKYVTVNVSVAFRPNHCFFYRFSFPQQVRLHYVESGDKSKPLMLFLHGVPEFWYSWRYQITVFSKNYWFVGIHKSWFILLLI